MAKSTPEDIYIALFRYGKKHIHDGVTLKDAFEHLRALEIDSEFLKSEEAFCNTFGRTFQKDAGTGKDKEFLNLDAYFKLLEYDELHQARASATQAKWIAIGAIVVAAVMAAASIGLQIWSILKSSGC